ncbi:MAG: hypothetical protein ACYDCL_02865 [Myxococcales bacterium]
MSRAANYQTGATLVKCAGTGQMKGGPGFDRVGTGDPPMDVASGTDLRLLFLGALLFGLGCGPSGTVTFEGSTSAGAGTGRASSGSGGLVGGSSSGGSQAGASTSAGASASSGTAGATGSSGSGSSSGGVSGTSSAGASSGGGSSGTGGATTGSAGGSGSSGGSTGKRCDRAKLTWNGPTSNSNGSCLTNLGWFNVQWGSVSGGPYPNLVNVGLPCTPGVQTPCGDGGSVAQLDCAYAVTGLTDGPWYFTVVAANTQGQTSAPSGEAAVTVACGNDGAACSSGAQCPPFQMCDLDGGGNCDTNCSGPACACVSDSQCAGGYVEQAGLGQGQICVGGSCVPGCNAATDCPVDLCCDVTNGAPGSCASPTGSNSCACAIDSQCNQDAEGRTTTCGTDGFCAAGCKTGFDCPAGQACDQSQGFVSVCQNPCTSGDCSCIFDSQCTDGGLGTGVACLAASGLCGAGCATGDDCGATEACNRQTNQCSATCATTGDPYPCACLTDQQCNGGQAGQGVICYSGSCNVGCHVNSDCPDGGSCTASGNLGSCG